MAQRGTPLSAWLVRRIEALAAGGTSIRGIARTLDVSRLTVRKYLRPPRPLAA